MRKIKNNAVAYLIYPIVLISCSPAWGQVPASAGDRPTSLGEVPVYPAKRVAALLPGHGADLPNGWRIAPAGEVIGEVGDLVTNMAVSPDGKILVSVNSGFLPHGLTVFDVKSHRRIQQIPLTSTWLGLAWSADGRKLYVSGGNAAGTKNANDPVAPIYEFAYANGKLSEAPTGRFVEALEPDHIWWAGIAVMRDKPRLYAANHGNSLAPTGAAVYAPDTHQMLAPASAEASDHGGIMGRDSVVVFDTETHQIVTRIPVETSPYQTVLSPDGKRLFVSNQSSGSLSVIDTDSNRVIHTIQVGRNPGDMKISADGRLFVVCANDNTVHVVDTRTLEVIEHISTTLTPRAPEGATPNALLIDEQRHLLYVANADNNSLAVVTIEKRDRSKVVGFIPTGWYPSALALGDRGATLFIGNAKGESGHPDPLGLHSPLTEKDAPFGPASASAPQPAVRPGSVHTLQTSSIAMLPLADLKDKLPQWTDTVVKNTPYRDSLLSEAQPPVEPSVIPREVGAGSPIKHIIYILKENRTYDQVFGDIPGTNGDPRLTLFGEEVTPNQHALVKEYVVLDNLYCDGEVSVDGHAWSTAAYATDFMEKHWPARYGRISGQGGGLPAAMNPSSGYIWDLARRKGLTYRTYEEGTVRLPAGATTVPVPLPGAEGLYGHVAPGYFGDVDVRDGEKLKAFMRDFKDYEANFDNPDPEKRLPNLTIMRAVGDHTAGTKPGWRTPTAMVAENDYVIGQIVDAVSHSKYWPETAIFIIEDDAQDGSDHVDARRTVGLVISPYVKRGVVDSTFYSTSSMLRSMELLLGLPPMSQFDAAAMPMYASFGATPIVKPFNAIKPTVDIDALNKPDAYGAAESAKMNLAEVDRAPMRRLNEIVWKSVKGADSPMPVPVHRFRPLAELADANGEDADDKDKN